MHKYQSLPQVHFLFTEICTMYKQGVFKLKAYPKKPHKPNNVSVPNIVFPPPKMHQNSTFPSLLTSPVPADSSGHEGIFSFLQPGAKSSAALSDPDKQTPATSELLSDHKFTVIRLQSILIKSGSKVLFRTCDTPSQSAVMLTLKSWFKLLSVKF